MRCKQRGTTAIEFAMVLPLLLLVIDGIMEFSLVMHNQVVITHAAREAVRAGVVLSMPKLTTAEIGHVAQRYCGDSLLSIGPARLPTVTVVQSADPVYLSPLSVTVSFTYQSLLLGPLMGAMNTPLVLSSRASGLNE